MNPADVGDALAMLQFLGACAAASIILGVWLVWQRWPR